MAASVGLLIATAFLSLQTFSAGENVTVNFGETGSDYTVNVNDVEWFRSSSLSVRYGGQMTWERTPLELLQGNGKDTVHVVTH